MHVGSHTVGWQLLALASNVSIVAGLAFLAPSIQTVAAVRVILFAHSIGINFVPNCASLALILLRGGAELVNTFAGLKGQSVFAAEAVSSLDIVAIAQFGNKLALFSSWVIPIDTDNASTINWVKNLTVFNCRLRLIDTSVEASSTCSKA